MEFNSNASCLIEKTTRKNKTTKLLNINTRFRNNYYRTQSTDFIYHLPYNIKNIINLRLESMQIPFNFYSFSSKIGTNEFTIELYELDIDSTNDATLGAFTDLDANGNPIKKYTKN